MKTQWTSRVVTDMVGEAGRGTCRADWLDVEYDLDEDREVALAGYGLVVEFNG